MIQKPDKERRSQPNPLSQCARGEGAPQESYVPGEKDPGKGEKGGVGNGDGKALYKRQQKKEMKRGQKNSYEKKPNSSKIRNPGGEGGSEDKGTAGLILPMRKLEIVHGGSKKGMFGTHPTTLRKTGGRGGGATNVYLTEKTFPEK